MSVYHTSEIAAIIGIHPNTVRLYEKIGFISAPVRLQNGYRIFSELHLHQIRLVKTALRAEILQNGLRKQAVEILRSCAANDVTAALRLAEEYIHMIAQEIQRVKEAAASVEKIIQSTSQISTVSSRFLTGKQAAGQLGISADTLRNWERNGLFDVRKSKNGYRIYNEADMEKLCVIRTLRCANYSLSAILRLMHRLSESGAVSVTEILDTPSPDDEIISVCDRLLTTLTQTKADADTILMMLKNIQTLQPST